jgi:hypothetical protein
VSVEVRVCLELGDTDGNTTLRVLLSNTVPREDLMIADADHVELAGHVAIEQMVPAAVTEFKDQLRTFQGAMRRAAERRGDL